MSILKMPERNESDGPIAVERPSEGKIAIRVSNSGEMSSVVMSEYNAWRAFGMLSVMLGIPLSPAAGKAIKL